MSKGYRYAPFDECDGKVSRKTGENQNELGYEFRLPLSNGGTVRITLTSEEIGYMKKQVEEYVSVR